MAQLPLYASDASSVSWEEELHVDFASRVDVDIAVNGRVVRPDNSWSAKGAVSPSNRSVSRFSRIDLVD